MAEDHIKLPAFGLDSRYVHTYWRTNVSHEWHGSSGSSDEVIAGEMIGSSRSRFADKAQSSPDWQSGQTDHPTAGIFALDCQASPQKEVLFGSSNRCSPVGIRARAVNMIARNWTTRIAAEPPASAELDPRILKTLGSLKRAAWFVVVLLAPIFLTTLSKN